MAITVQADLSAALSLHFRPKLQTQINSVAVLPYLLPVVTGAGKVCAWTCEFSGAADAAASAEGVARSSSDADDEIEVPATLSWAQYDKTSSVSDLAMASTASNTNPGSVRTVGGDLLMGRLQGQVRRVGLGIAGDLYAGNPGASPAELAGAALAIDSSGTFAGIDPTTYTEWVATESTAALASISFAKIRAWFTAIYDACGEMPEFVTCPSNVYNAVRDLYNNFDAHIVREMMLARGGGADGSEARLVKLHAGMRSVEVDQVPFVLDRHATANTMYAWNTAHVEIHQLDPHASVLEGGEEAIQELFRRLAGDASLVLPREEIEGMLARGPGLTPSIKMLGNRGLSKEAVVYLFAQLQWKRRNAFGKYTWT